MEVHVHVVVLVVEESVLGLGYVAFATVGLVELLVGNVVCVGVVVDCLCDIVALCHPTAQVRACRIGTSLRSRSGVLGGVGAARSTVPLASFLKAKGV